MSKTRLGSDSSSMKTRSEGSSVGVAPSVDIEALVSTACQKAIEVLKIELLKTFSDITARLESVERRLSVMDQTTLDHGTALNDLSTRVMDIQITLDNATTATATIGTTDCVQKEIESVRSEARAAICAANDVEQYGRRNNVRIRGLAIRKDEDCRSMVIAFLKEKLQVDVTTEDIEAAHILPSRPELGDNASQPSSQGLQQRGPPVIIVRFWERDLRDQVLRSRRRLKKTRFAIIEDLTALNAKTLSRISKDPNVVTAWSWSGKVHALTKTGNKVTVRPFQSLL